MEAAQQLSKDVGVRQACQALGIPVLRSIDNSRSQRPRGIDHQDDRHLPLACKNVST
jgi:hypothetical protein